MAKTNFSKVEDLLSSSLTKMKVDQWGKMADIAQSVEKPEMRKLVEKASAASAKSELDKKALVHGLQRELQTNKDPAFYETLGIKAEELRLMLQDPKALKADGWAKLQKIRAAIKEIKKNKEMQASENINGTLIEKERHKHINKRFNINEKWLPLK